MHSIVTGANRGLGLEFVTQLAARGDHVTATARNPDAATDLQALAKIHQGQVTIARLDMADPKSIAAFASSLGPGPLDVLIHNAGIYPDAGPLGELDYTRVLQGFEVNTLGPLRLSEALLGRLVTSAKPVIMSVTSQMGSIEDNGSGGSYAYRMSKAALNMGMRSMAKDLVKKNVTVFVIHPGWVQTDMGGPNAKIDVQTSIKGMLSVLDGATHTHSGRFMNWDGSQLPW